MMLSISHRDYVAEREVVFEMLKMTDINVFLCKKLAQLKKIYYLCENFRINLCELFRCELFRIAHNSHTISLARSNALCQILLCRVASISHFNTSKNELYFPLFPSLPHYEGTEGGRLKMLMLFALKLRCFELKDVNYLY